MVEILPQIGAIRNDCPQQSIEEMVQSISRLQGTRIVPHSKGSVVGELLEALGRMPLLVLVKDCSSSGSCRVF
jgi:hypothetical protein